MIGTIAASAIDSTTLVVKKPRTVSCQLSGAAAAGSAASGAAVATIPAPGRNSSPSTTATTAATTDRPIIQAKVRSASRPVPDPVMDPQAAITEVMTSGTIAIWTSRMKASPTTFRLPAHSPVTRPNAIPATAASAIRTAGCFIAASLMRSSRRGWPGRGGGPGCRWRAGHDRRAR